MFTSAFHVDIVNAGVPVGGGATVGDRGVTLPSPVAVGDGGDLADNVPRSVGHRGNGGHRRVH